MKNNFAITINVLVCVFAIMSNFPYVINATQELPQYKDLDLITAIRSDKLDGFKSILEKNKKLNENLGVYKIQGTVVRTVMYEAVRMRAFKILKYLVTEKKLSPKEDGYRLLFQAFYEKSLKIFEFLLKNGADPNSKSEVGEPLLYKMVVLAAGKEDECLEYLELMLKFGANSNLASTWNLNSGATPMHAAAIHGHLKIAAMLLKYGAKLDLKAKYTEYWIQECTPLDCSKTNEDKTLYEYLTIYNNISTNQQYKIENKAITRDLIFWLCDAGLSDDAITSHIDDKDKPKVLKFLLEYKTRSTISPKISNRFIKMIKDSREKLIKSRAWCGLVGALNSAKRLAESGVKKLVDRFKASNLYKRIAVSSNR